MRRREFITLLGSAAILPFTSSMDAALGEGENLQSGARRPLRQSINPNYFGDSTGTPLILCGSHSWNTLQDWGTNGVVRALDFDAFVTFLKTHGHNFTLLWSTELPRFRGLPTTEAAPPDFTVSPFPWMRTGPGLATDGGLKFDLTKFNQVYFDRLRARVQTLNKASIHAGIYLFTGEFLLRFRFTADGYPFTGPNNVNGIDDGYRAGTGTSAVSSITMTAANAITEYQDDYVRQVIDELNDLPNVLWIVSEEAPTNSTWWNSHLISLIKEYEKGKRYQHPVGYAVLDRSQDSILYNSDADWVAPSARLSATQSCDNGKSSCKVSINDSDHSYFGMWNESAQKNRNYAWENFMNGNQVLFMDPCLVHYPRQNRNITASPVNGIGSKPDPRWDNFRDNLGYIVRYSRKLNLAEVRPQSSLCSTGYCLAQTPSVGAEYLVYAPDGAVRPIFGPPEGRFFRPCSPWRAGCAIVVQQHYRRLLADRPVRAFFVVVLAPILHLFSRVRKVQEPVSVQTFGSEATVEGFNERIVGWFSWPGEVKRDAALVGPQIQIARHKLGALVDANA